MIKRNERVVLSVFWINNMNISKVFKRIIFVLSAVFLLVQFSWIWNLFMILKIIANGFADFVGYYTQSSIFLALIDVFCCLYIVLYYIHQVSLI